MATLTQSSDPTQKAAMIESVRPTIHDHHHQDSVFGNSFQAKSNFVVHPDWNSEGVNAPKSTPLNRPPWAWEQPRYRQNVQYPITYNTPRYTEKQKQPTVPYQPSWFTAFRSDVGAENTPNGAESYRAENVPLSQPTTTAEERQRIQWHLHY